jgi:TolB-like protein/AraC-like DNA-binding protein/Tfp pilus assembly protein PilF
MIESQVADQIFIRKLTEIILENLVNEKFGIKELLHESGMSYYNLSRRLHSINKRTINQFIREVRLEKALEMLKNGRLTASEVAYNVGFSSPAYFNKCFNEYFGYPPGKVKKAEAVAQVELIPVLSGEADKRSTNRRVIAYALTGILFLIILFLLFKKTILNDKNVNDINQEVKTANSIAVLPFKNLSDSAGNQYFVDGIMEDILTLLCRVRDLRVVTRTSVEQFRNSTMSTSEIAEKLKVNYLVEGCVQKSGNIFRLWVQLIDAKNGQHLWAEVYNEPYSTDIFRFQSRVAKRVAASLDAIIIPNDQKIIDAEPTKDMRARKFAMKASEMGSKWWETRDDQYLRIASNYLDEALKLDPGYLNAKAGKGIVYLNGGRYDSARIYFVDVLKTDPENRGALDGIGTLYMYTNKNDSAVKYFQKQVEVSPNDPWANFNLGQELIFGQNKVIDGLPFIQKAYDLGGSSNASIIMNIGNAYIVIGDYPKALKYLRETLLLEPSWCGMVQSYCNLLFIQGNYQESLNFLDSIGKFSPCDNACDIMRFYYHVSYKDFRKAEEYLKKAINTDRDYYSWEKGCYDVYFNYLLIETGRKSEALTGLRNSIKNYEADIQKSYGLETARARLKLAASFAMLGENDEALEYLSQLEKYGLFEFPITLSFPGFDSLRNDPEFKAIVKRIEDQRAAVREKIREMEESGELHL